ncbi:MAG: hypothetical protein ACREJ2_05060, partial [Planctomycetota bacterium]
IKAARVLLWLGNVVFGCASVVKWTGARVTLETIGWPDVDHLKTWTSTVYEQAFGPFGFWSTTVFLVAALAVVAWLTWRALGQRLRQMEGPRPKMAAAGLPEKETPRWAAFAWLAPVFLPCCVAAWASQKETACVVLVAGAAWLVAGAVAAILSSRHHPDAADSAALPANSAASANPAEQVQLASEGLPAPAAAPAAPAAAVSAANPVIAAATGLTAPASATLPGEPSHPHRHFIHPWVGLGVLGALLVILGWAVSGTHLRRSAGYRRVWWDLTWQMIEARPAGYGFGAHIFRAEFHREFAATPAAAARLQAAIPPDLQPIPQPGWGPRDLAFHRKWLTWELSKGFDPHDEVLQVLFEGGWAWLALLAVGALGALWLRGGLGAGPSPVLDLLVAALAALLAVDIASGGLEKIAACIIAAWIAWGCRRS